jgi:malonyl-CoA O-methyltransferase
MIFDKHTIIRNFNKAAANYDQYATLQRKASDYLFTLISKNISKANLVIDAGSGTGYFHELLRKNKLYCPLVQLDIA